MSRRSKVSPQIRQRRVRDRRRTTRIFGLKEDAGRWYRCHHCDFVLDLWENKEAFGDMQAPAGNFNAYDESEYNAWPSPLNPLTFGRESRDVTLVLLDSTGGEQEVMTYPDTNFVGCPLCGTRSNRT